ncbi:MAG: radical SAM protein [Thermodesulfobacteriota bacterium]|nr:radical SAM protein [Thermodesulfobacteriota bacterium]
MKIKLVNPAQLDENGEPIKFPVKMAFGITLPYIAALIPPGHDIQIVDDGVEDIDFDEPVDLVAMTALSCQAPRAYWIAGKFRQRNVPVVMGGFHATMLPEEALAHCDAVARGEAEGVMEQIVTDAAHGKLRQVYESEIRRDLKGLPVPRYDLVNFDNYMAPYYPVQATRGCPHNCDFCTVTLFYKKTYRKRPVDEVIDELRQAGKHLLIVDDNLTADRNYAMELFQKMIPLKKRWCGQFDIAATTDAELLKAASASGCLWVYIGVETPDPEKARSVNKTPNLKITADMAMKQLRRYHIEPFVSMMIGFDDDTPETGRQIIAFCNRSKIGAFFLYILTPPPGSALYDRLEEKGVPMKAGWHLYDGTHSVYDTDYMTSEALEEMYREIYKGVYSHGSIFRRTMIPPHFLLAFTNWYLFRPAFLNSNHPWLGTFQAHHKMLVRVVVPIGSLMTHPIVRKISRFVRLEWLLEKYGGKNE